ncbi:hypothetical protein V6N13_068694 [Hibiscus sabdariffa]|uniref:Uncharacterized protein n=1 Tax=Hibiscus sabdariffa TaxID=183260 RepID=A0ABR2QND1_9ROSI
MRVDVKRRGEGRGLFIEEKSGSGDKGGVDTLQFAWLIVANGLHVTKSGRAGGYNRQYIVTKSSPERTSIQDSSGDGHVKVLFEGRGREEPTVTDANDFLSLSQWLCFATTGPQHVASLAICS